MILFNIKCTHSKNLHKIQSTLTIKMTQKSASIYFRCDLCIDTDRHMTDIDRI